MITLFSVPKAFAGRNAVPQMNAIESWRRLHPDAEILLFGDDEGVGEAAAKVGARHVPAIKRNASGTPLLGDIFRQADALASFGLLGFVNTDIVLFRDLLAATEAARRAFPQFLLVGRRTNLDLDEALDFSPEWERRLREMAARQGRLHGHQGSDFFVYPRSMFHDMPEFAIGRTSWDNWLMFRAREKGAALIDATPDVLSVHQNHDYAHVASSRDAWKGPEAAANLVLAGGESRIFTVYDASHILTRGSISPTTAPWYWLRLVRARTERSFIAWLTRNPGVRAAFRALKRMALRTR